METQTLKAELREETGKGPARRLRSRGLIPATFYGPGAETTSLAVSPRELMKVMRMPKGKNSTIKLHFEQEQREELALVKQLDVHPVSDDPLHVDFFSVSMDREVDVEVPFHAKGRALGVQKGGTLHETLRSLPVRATPDKIPADIVVDVTPLDVNGLIRVQDLELPEGVTVLSPPHRTLITIMPEEKKGGSAASGDSGDKGAKKKKK